MYGNGNGSGDGAGNGNDNGGRRGWKGVQVAEFTKGARVGMVEVSYALPLPASPFIIGITTRLCDIERGRQRTRHQAGEMQDAEARLCGAPASKTMTASRSRAKVA
jgi:hypothetical protein